MDKFVIVGGQTLRGRIEISGAKNSALPCLAATLLSEETVMLKNVPYVRDLITMRRLLEDLGCKILVPELRTHQIDSSEIESFEAPYELVKTMRASVLVLGPLAARFGKVRVSLPGGCAIGSRPIDLHLNALEKMGAKIEIKNGVVEATADRLQGADIVFDVVTVTGTENVLMAATLAKGTTRLINAACEPEVTDLAELLVKMGAKIEGIGTPTLTVHGVEKLHGAIHSIIPDRIETGTFLVAGAIAGSELELTHCQPAHLTAVLDKLRQVGVEIEQKNDSSLIVRGNKPLKAVDLTTQVYPGFPTDMQAQYITLLLAAEGDAQVTETIFENRFMHVSEMQRMGAIMRVHGRTVQVHGGANLTGTTVMASDLRASASLVLAGLIAEGETVIERVYHIDRGYEKIEEKLQEVGANIRRIKE